MKIHSIMATHNGILKILISQHISPLNTIQGTKLKLKLHFLIVQIRKCSYRMFITINRNNKNERKIAKKN